MKCVIHVIRCVIHVIEYVIHAIRCVVHMIACVVRAIRCAIHMIGCVMQETRMSSWRSDVSFERKGCVIETSKPLRPVAKCVSQVSIRVA